MTEKLDRLRAWFEELGSAAVAYSGGTDSAFVLKVAHDALGERAVGVTAASASLARAELEDARSLAARIGARHVILQSGELDDPRYRENTTARCYFCKSECYALLSRYARDHGYAVVVDGTNADDLSDFRPGREAAKEKGVRSPLVELALTKREIRELSRTLGLPTWDKPAAACLSSRVPHGTAVTPEVLSMIERAEVAVRRHGIRQLRVRHHDAIARIEVDPSDFDRLLACRSEIIAELRAIGYRFVTLDLEGFRSGSLSGGKRPSA